MFDTFLELGIIVTKSSVAPETCATATRGAKKQFLWYPFVLGMGAGALVLNSVPRGLFTGTTRVVLEQGFLHWHDKRRLGTVFCVVVQSNVFCVVSAQQRGNSVTIDAHSSSASYL